MRPLLLRTLGFLLLALGVLITGIATGQDRLVILGWVLLAGTAAALFIGEYYLTRGPERPLPPATTKEEDGV